MKRLHVYKYQGAGNDFVILDNRRGDIVLSPARSTGSATAASASEPTA